MPRLEDIDDGDSDEEDSDNVPEKMWVTIGLSRVSISDSLH